MKKRPAAGPPRLAGAGVTGPPAPRSMPRSTEPFAGRQSGRARPLMSRGARILLALAPLLAASWIPTSRAADAVIERIDVVGNRRMTTDAFIFASGLKVGDRYDPADVKRAFRRLWDKDLFLDLSVEASDGEKGKILSFAVTERPILVSVDYDNVRSITKSNIEDMFRQRGLEIGVGKPVNQKTLWKAEEYIKDLLGTKGYLDPTVHAKKNEISSTSTAVHFEIRQGPRTRIKKITFVGNSVFSSHKLKSALKQTREHSLLATMTGKDLWRPALYDQDVQKIFELYKQFGYLDVEIKPPVLDIREPGKEKREKKEQETAQRRLEKERKAAQKAAARKRPPRPGAPLPAIKEPHIRKWVYLTVKVKEGPQYKVGEMKVKGNTVFTDQQVLSQIPLKPGAIVDDTRLQFGLDRLRADYGLRGYIYATATKSVVRREGNVADITIELSEDHPYKVDRIEFEGNTVTHDPVLRREMRVDEGSLLNRGQLDLSNYKIQQLSYVRPDPDPIIEPVENTELAKVKIKLEEQGRNEIQVGGGYSGLEGFFFQGSYSTRNFLGRGEIISAYLQAGGRTSRYQLSFQEPWLGGKPYLLGASIFRRDTAFATNQSTTGAGGTLSIGRQFGPFTNVGALYSFERVTFTNTSSSTTVSSQLANTTTTVGSVTPSFSYNTVNSVFRPSRGHSVFLTSQIAGSAFGGSNNFYKPSLQLTQYIPFVGRTFFGLHGDLGYVAAYGQGTTAGGSILGIPQFERFFIGGDLLGPRVFETRSLSPLVYVTRDGSAITDNRNDIVRFKGRNVFGQKIQVFCDLRYDLTPADGLCNSLQRDRIGGNRFFLAQFEYAVPFADPFTLAFFMDAGTTYAESESLDFRTLRVSAGIEARIYLPVFQAPIRFILGQPIRQQPGDPTNTFQFSIGTSF